MIGEIRRLHQLSQTGILRDGAISWPCLITSADELHNLQLIAFGKLGLGPVLPRDNVAVQFNRDAIGLHAQLLDEAGKREWNVEAALFPVDDQFHLHRILAVIGLAVQGCVPGSRLGCRRYGLGFAAREVPRPAEENAGLRDDAILVILDVGKRR